MNKDNLGNDLIKNDGERINASEEKRKKNLYVPDEEIMNYIKEKKAEEALNSKSTASVDESSEDTFTADTDETNAGAEVKEDEAAAETTAKINNDFDIKVIPSRIKGIFSRDKKTGEREKFSFKKLLIRLKEFFIPKKGDTKKQIIIKIVAIVAALTLISTTVYLSYYFIDLGQQDAANNNIRNIYDLDRNDDTVNADGQYSKFDTLKALNSDIVGWLNIENTKIDNPVYQTLDNDYYITHDMNKETNSYGALFLDYRCKSNPLTLSQNQIIYGHNMRYGAMFGTLNEYRKLDFYKSSPLISFDTLYEKRTYKIFAMMIVNTTDDNTFGYNFSAYRASFTSQAEFTQWVQHCKDRSLIDTNVDVQAYDEIITLSTCCYDFDDARFVVMGRLVREGEDEAVDTSTATVNSDVIYSKEWYVKKNLPIPEIVTTEEE